MAGKASDDIVRCSFCNKPQSQVRKLIAGPNGAYICDECIEVCSEIIEEEFEYDDDRREFDDINLLTPEEIKAFLDEYVIGQDEAKKVLSVAVYNHYKRIMAGSDLGVDLQKSNILMLGPTGCGKTLLAQTLAKILNVPFAIADATALTEAGYVGEDVESILLKVIQAADGDIERAEHGIIYIDKIIETRLDKKSIGFNAEIAKKHEEDVDVLLHQVLPQDLVKFGLIPELVGRVPVTVSLDLLDKEALIRILTEPKSSLVKQYQKLMELDGVKLEFDKAALDAIAETSLARKTGARGLRAIMEDIMMDTMFRVPSDDTIKGCMITKDVVEGKGQPLYECDGEERKSFLTSESA